MLGVSSATATFDLPAVSGLLVLTSLFVLATIRTSSGKIFSLYGVTTIALVLFTASQAFVSLIVSDADVAIRQFLLSSRFSVDAIAVTFAVVGCFLSAFHTGALTVTRTRVTSERPVRTTELSKHVASFATLMFAISMPFASWQLLSLIQAALVGGYFSLYDLSQIQTQSFIGTISSFAVPMAIILVALKTSHTRTVALGFLIVYSIVMIAIGFRGWGALSLLATIWVYRKSVGTIPTAILVPSALMLVVAFPVIATVRNTPIQEITDRQIAQAYTDIQNPLTVFLAETGGSAATIAWTVELVPSERPYGLGSSFLYSSTSILPNLFYDLHPSAANSLSGWLTKRVAPELAAQGGGLGYSFFAELYYNFGLLFSIPFAFASGYLVSRISNLGELRGPTSVWVAFNGVLMTFLPFVARGDSSLLFRPIVWFIVLPLVWSWIIIALRNRH